MAFEFGMFHEFQRTAGITDEQAFGQTEAILCVATLAQRVRMQLEQSRIGWNR
jgi:hypothetical protein